MQYVISLRINNAMNLMENTDYNIEQIAEAVGYDNPSYFRRLFHKHTGLSPSEYRQRHKK
jgi:YesN/AraC family two-component response regulator